MRRTEKIMSASRLQLPKWQKADAELLSDRSAAWTADDQTFISRPVVRGDSGSRFCVLLKRFNHKKISALPP